jgi:hypothetical protein
MNIDIYRNKLIGEKKKKPVNSEFYGPLGLLVTLICRDDKIRTCDPLHPMQVRYRAALRPEKEKFWGCEGNVKIHFWLKKLLWPAFPRFNFYLAGLFSIFGAILAFRKATSNIVLS